jgi:hypothetical protein
MVTMAQSKIDFRRKLNHPKLPMDCLNTWKKGEKDE